MCRLPVRIALLAAVLVPSAAAARTAATSRSAAVSAPATDDPADARETTRRESPAPPPAAGISPVWFYLAAGAAGVLGLSGAIAGGNVLGLREEYDTALAACRGGDAFACFDGPRIVAEYEDYRLATNLLLFSAAGFGITALVLAFFTDFGRHDQPDDNPATGPAVQFAPPFGCAGLQLALRF